MSIDLGLMSIFISLAIPFAIFLGRNWLVAWISKGTQHRFDAKLEKLRADFRRSEEQFKAELRKRESEISALRNAVLSGSANRQSLLDKRRFDAVERIWTAVHDLGQFKTLTSMMAVLNFKNIAKKVADPKIQEFLGIIGHAVPDMKVYKDVARDEEPYLPDLAWAYFRAYSTVVMGAYAQYMVLKSGFENPEALLTKEVLQKVLKAALPHQIKFIDEQEPESYYYLLEELEQLLLAELKKMLDGKSVDKADADRVKQIMTAVNKADADDAKQLLSGISAE